MTKVVTLPWQRSHVKSTKVREGEGAAKTLNRCTQHWFCARMEHDVTPSYTYGVNIVLLTEISLRLRSTQIMSVHLGVVPKICRPAHVNRFPVTVGILSETNVDEIKWKVQGCACCWSRTDHSRLSSVIVTMSTVLCCHPVFTPRIRKSTTSPHQIASVIACKENKATRVSASSSEPQETKFTQTPCHSASRQRSVWLLRRVICSIFDLLAVSVLSAGLKYDSISEGKVNRTVLGRRREGQPPPYPNCTNTNTHTKETKQHNGSLRLRGWIREIWRAAE